LSRDEGGLPLRDPPILWEIESDPVLAGTKIVAEAWDAAGLYQVGTFIGHRWAEWNGQYRDDVRRFVMAVHRSATFGGDIEGGIASHSLMLIHDGIHLLPFLFYLCYHLRNVWPHRFVVICRPLPTVYWIW
jgi:hypothetical protein